MACSLAFSSRSLSRGLWGQREGNPSRRNPVPPGAGRSWQPCPSGMDRGGDPVGRPRYGNSHCTHAKNLDSAVVVGYNYDVAFRLSL